MSSKFKVWMKEVNKNGVRVESHFRLFLREGVEMIQLDDCYELMRFAPNKMVEGLTKLLQDENQRVAAKSKLFKIVSLANSEEATLALLNILSRLKSCNSQAYDELRLTKLTKLDYYARLFAGDDPFKVDRIAHILEPEPIVAYLRNRNVTEYDKLLDRIEPLLRHKDIHSAACLIIRGLPHCTDVPESTMNTGEWYYDFIAACLTHGYTRMIPRTIDPEFKDDFDRHRAIKDAEAKIRNEENYDLVEDGEEKVTGPRDQADYLKERIQNAAIEYVASDYFLRPYQNELVMHANSGRNTIICAPTGSGKTLVAVDIIKNHLTRMHQENKVARCVMLVPTVPLVDQQAYQFVEFLGSLRDSREIPYWIDGFSGVENTPSGRANRLLACDICVMTPQILINMMNSILRSERVYFTDFSLIIFDECHHCDRDHPYKILMNMLEDCKAENGYKPQIVGLTASMGVGTTSWDMQACRDHMLELCSNLKAECISTVRHQLENLKSHVMPPVDVVRKVNRPVNNGFVDRIDATMLRIEEEMRPFLQRIVDEKQLPLTSLDIQFPAHIYQARYQTLVGSLKKHVQRISDPSVRLLLVRSIDHLSHYFHSILISDLLPNSYALEYLESKMENYENQKHSENAELIKINSHLLDIYHELRKRLENYANNENLEEKEILKQLYAELKDQFEKEPTSRCLIFVATRSCAQRLSDHLTEVEALEMFYKKKNVGYMVSSNQSGIAGGQSSQEQREMRLGFDNGTIKVLVVTSVAEEGINIAACNLIIKYNNVGSERTMIQRRGRARQKNSRSILLALDTGVEQQEFLNMQKEAMMMRCIEDLQEKDDNILRKMIIVKTDQLKRLRENDLRMAEQKRNNLCGRRYKLNCRSCSNLICSSAYVRSIAETLFVVCDPTVWDRSEIMIVKRPTKDQFYTKCARWNCKSCSQEWGTIVKYSNVFLPNLLANIFTMEREDQKDQSASDFGGGNRKGWKHILDYFNVDPISMKNIKEVFTAFNNALPTMHDEMERQEAIANAQFVAKMNEKRAEKKTKLQVFLDE